MSESNITVSIVNDRILIKQLPPSGREVSADIIEVSLSQWPALADAINKLLDEI